MKPPFLDALRSDRVLLMDGAMGTELQRAGLQAGECPELWNRSRPEQVQAVHRAYLDAGADVILTHSFLANPHSLRRYDLQDSVRNLNDLAVRNAKQGAGDAFVLADVGPFSPGCDGLADMCLPFVNTSGILLETWSDPVCAAAFLNQLAECQPLRELPVLVSATYGREWLRDSNRPEASPERWAAWAAAQPQIVALGVNCGRDIKIEDCAEIVQRYRDVTDLPLFARPNAGTPVRIGESWVYPHSPEQMAAEIPLMLEAGANMLGGCCGTTPAHIAAFRSVIDEWNRAKLSPEAARR